jgi:hypothetical protein
MSDQDLIKEANWKDRMLINDTAKVMGWYFEGAWINPVLNWNPLTNANHTKLLKDKAVELGLYASVECSWELFSVDVKNEMCVVVSCGVGKDELRTTTEAIVEAVKKMREYEK